MRELYEDEAEARAKAKEDADRGGRGGRKGAAGPTAGRKIRDQCGALVAALMQCEPHYVRCVKSNDDKRALACDDERVSHQCKYLGLPENVRVRRAGFCYRTEYHRFLERFKTLSKATYPREWTGSDRDGAREVVRAAAKLGGPLATLGDGGETQFGRSKLFVKKPETYFALEKLRDDAHARYAAKISRAGRRSKDLRDFVALAKDVSRRFAKAGKRRRASSANRPYAGDYLRDDAARAALAACATHRGDGSRVLFADGDTFSQLVKDGKGPAAFSRRLVACTAKSLYVLEDRGAGAPFRRFALRRVVDVGALQSVAVSTRADGVVVVSCGAPQDAPKAVKADLVKSGAWQKNGDVLECPASGKKFGVFGARRHHCRSSGRIYAAEACEARQAFPDRGWPKPERVRDDLFGLEPCDALEDLVFYSERRSELVGVLLRANGGATLACADNVALNGAAAASVRPAAALRLGASSAGRRGAEARPPTLAVEGDALLLDAPPGLADDVAERRRRAADERRSRREAERRAERARRKERDAARDAARAEERRRLLKEKKARKRADREARARAAGAVVPARRPSRKALQAKRDASPRAARPAAPAPRAAAAAPRAAAKPAPPPPRAKTPPPPPKPKPAPPPPVPSALRDAEYYWQHTDGDQRGPSTWAEYKAAYDAKETHKECLVYAAGVADDWKTVRDVPDLVAHLAPPKRPPMPPMPAMPRAPPPPPAAAPAPPPAAPPAPPPAAPPAAPPPAAPPAAADPARQEDALDDAAFVAALGCDRAAFAKMPKWKQDNKKKKAGLF